MKQKEIQAIINDLETMKDRAIKDIQYIKAIQQYLEQQKVKIGRRKEGMK